MKKEQKTRFVVVTTDSTKRGVFGGDFVSRKGDVVVLENAHMCVYWPAENRGVLGLAATGPVNGARITPVIPRIQLNGVTALMDTTDEAAAAWRKSPWTR
jgi:hypothetical protein